MDADTIAPMSEKEYRRHIQEQARYVWRMIEAVIVGIIVIVGLVALLVYAHAVGLFKNG